MPNVFEIIKWGLQSLRVVHFFNGLISLCVGKCRFSTAVLGGGSVFPLVVVTSCHLKVELNEILLQITVVVNASLYRSSVCL